MKLSRMHPEDVKAAIRKRFASVSAFERQYDLPPKSVTDLLRGRASERVSNAINSVISRPISDFSQSEYSENSRRARRPHRQNAEAR